MSKIRKLALGGFAALALILVLGTVGPMFFNCENAFIDKADSPDGQYRAVIGVATCKDSTRNGVWLHLFNIETGSNVRRTLVKDTSITDFELIWRGSDVVEIIIPGVVDWDDARGWGSFESVRVEYRRASHGDFSN